MGHRTFNNTPLYILNDFAFGLPKYLWHELPQYVDALAAKNSMIIAVETSNNPWLQTQSEKVIVYKQGKYEDYNNLKKKRESQS